MNNKLDKIIKIMLFIALGIMAKYVYTFSFSLGNMPEISINLVALPSIIASILLGPFWGAFIGGTTDITAHLLHPMGPYIPQILLVTILRGFLPGFLMRYIKFKNKYLLKLFLAIGTTLIISLSTYFDITSFRASPIVKILCALLKTFLFTFAQILYTGLFSLTLKFLSTSGYTSKNQWLMGTFMERDVRVRN